MTERICKQCCLHWPAQSYPTFEHLFYGAILAISGNYRSKSYRKTKKHHFDQNLFDLGPWSKVYYVLTYIESIWNLKFFFVNIYFQFYYILILDEGKTSLLWIRYYYAMLQGYYCSWNPVRMKILFMIFHGITFKIVEWKLFYYIPPAINILLHVNILEDRTLTLLFGSSLRLLGFESASWSSSTLPTKLHLGLSEFISASWFSSTSTLPLARSKIYLFIFPKFWHFFVCDFWS